MKNLIVFLSTLLFSLQLFSADFIGRVTKMRGTIMKVNKAANINEPLKEGSKINIGDSLISESGSFAKVLMVDDTVFSIGPNTEFAFENFKMKTANDRDATYNLVRGKLRSMFTRKAPTRSLKIKTPLASMAVRGTEIVSDVYKVNGKMRADIGLLSGKLEVHSKEGKIYNLKPKDVFEAVRGGKKMAKANFKMRKMDNKVFEALKRSPKKGGQQFLFDALKKKRKNLTKKAKFNFAKADNKQKKRKKMEMKVQKKMGKLSKRPGAQKVMKKMDKKDVPGIQGLDKGKGLKKGIKKRLDGKDLSPLKQKLDQKRLPNHSSRVMDEVKKDFGVIDRLALTGKADRPNFQKDKMKQKQKGFIERKLRRRAAVDMRRQRLLDTLNTQTVKPCPAGTIRIGTICQKVQVPTGTTSTTGTIDGATGTIDSTTTILKEPTVQEVVNPYEQQYNNYTSGGGENP